MYALSSESIETLRALKTSGGRLHGRLDLNVPFLRSDPTHADSGWRAEVPVSVAEELHQAGLIQIDETAPIADIYVFEVSDEGAKYVGENG